MITYTIDPTLQALADRINRHCFPDSTVGQAFVEMLGGNLQGVQVPNVDRYVLVTADWETDGEFMIGLCDAVTGDCLSLPEGLDDPGNYYDGDVDRQNVVMDAGRAVQAVRFILTGRW